ncbi:uroporphyrinogen-III C-methyltransferase [Bowmanella pacifica]|uniref:Tetrapyrrole biosynthesis uroporphyrinogen III synthase domain-containing protein n=1 Tax=Bowmanella pacifica TaxID=502051 RepID=A0A918DH46_9ALTE|nr:uroporphyrinogen-III C-methyltransferase [Bowmanella pacifica]GGO66235.1 hypothetical protein GCM10010982_09950 [Bowmanella pacifica]
MKKFLLLRPEGKCQVSTKVLNQAGLPTVGYPLMAITPDEQGLSTFADTLMALPAQSKVIFTSTSAAELAVQSMQKQAWPSQLSYFAVGQATASRLQDIGVQAQYPEQEDSEGLLDLAELKLVNSQSVLLVKGKGGRELISQTLTERGADVHPLIIYQRQIVAKPTPTDTWQTGEIQCIMATSGELLEAAFATLDNDWLRHTPWILINARLLDKAKGLGIQQVILSHNASDAALIKAARQFMEQNAMADAPVEQTETTSEPVTKAHQADKVAAKTRGNGVLWLLTLVNFLLVVGIAGGGYWWWQQQQALTQQQQSQWQDIQQRVNSQEQTLVNKLDSALQASAQQRQQSLQASQEKLQLVEQQVQSNLQALRDMNGRRPSDWLLAEADYLVRMAGRKLWLEQDVNTALLLLADADQRLADLADPSLLPIRQLLANDMQSVRQLDTQTPTKVSLELGALMAGLDTLPMDMVVLPESSDEDPTNQALSENVSDWQANLKRSWRALVDDFITVRRRNGETKPLLSDKQQWLVREQLRHYLMLAQQAVFNNDNANYRQSLEQAQSLLTFYYAMQDSRVSAFANNLHSLLQTDIAVQLPGRLQAAQPLEQILAERVAGAFKDSQS